VTSAGSARLSIDEIEANPARVASLSAAQRQAIVQRCAAVILLVSGGPESGDTSTRDDTPTRIVDDSRLLTAAELTA
jgi:hypothetical protein